MTVRFYFHIGRLWLDAAHWHSAVIWTETSVEVDRLCGYFKALSMHHGLANQEDGEGSQQAGWTSLDGTGL